MAPVMAHAEAPLIASDASTIVSLALSNTPLRVPIKPTTIDIIYLVVVLNLRVACLFADKDRPVEFD
jgi:hypothetical protein